MGPVRLSFAVSFFMLTFGCASTRRPSAQYVRATPVEAPVKSPTVIQVPKPLPLPGQLQHLPVTTQVRRPEKAPWKVVDDANRKAAAGPERDGYFNAIMTYDYAEGSLYQVYAAPLRLTSIQLAPGEHIVGKPAAGDTIRWVMGIGRSGPDGAQQEHLFVKPTRPGLETTMAITTDRRTYYLELHSFEDTYMAAVQWRYPHDELDALDGAAAHDQVLSRATTATNVNLEALNFSYRVTVVKGTPVWVPVQVFDDGSRTFVRFPEAMLNREAPALFVLSSTDEVQLVNYRVKNDYYIVDRLIDRAELHVGQKDQEIVRISRAR